jgi:hypothetical protein
VRTTRPIGPFCRAKTCSTRERTSDAALARAEHARAALDGFSGVLQVDGYAAYKTLRDARPPGTLILAHCWAHGRRKLREVFDRDASPMAEEGLRRIAELYRIEAAIAGLPPDARRSVRQTQSKPLVEDFGLWLASARAKISAKSRMGEKLAYFANHCEGLQVFLEDGRVEMDTNPVENAIRPLAGVESLCPSSSSVWKHLQLPLRSRVTRTSPAKEGGGNRLRVEVFRLDLPWRARHDLFRRQHAILDQSPDDMTGNGKHGCRLAHGQPDAILLGRAERVCQWRRKIPPVGRRNFRPLAPGVSRPWHVGACSLWALD